jgi:ABC-type glutathione transport system ATPase component
VLVLEHGRVCEEGPAGEVLSTHRHRTTPMVAWSPPAVNASGRETKEVSNSLSSRREDGAQRDRVRPHGRLRRGPEHPSDPGRS